MAYEPKILLTIYFEAGALVRQSEPVEKEYILTKKDISPNQKWKNNEGNKVVKKGKYYVYPLVNKTTTQKITMCGEAYEYFISSECPEWYHNTKEWKFKLNKEQRLLAHLKRTCDHFGGKKFTYSIIED